MSFTAKEVEDLKKLVAPKGKTFKYSYKNQGCEIERELTPEEYKDWCARIDAVSPASDPLCLKVGHDEMHWGEGTIVCAGVAGSYFGNFDNLWPATRTKVLLFAALSATAHSSYAMTRVNARLAGAENNFVYGSITDGAVVFIYQILAFGNDVRVGIMAVMER